MGISGNFNNLGNLNYSQINMKKTSGKAEATPNAKENNPVQEDVKTSSAEAALVQDAQKGQEMLGQYMKSQLITSKQLEVVEEAPKEPDDTNGCQWHGDPHIIDDPRNKKESSCYKDDPLSQILNYINEHQNEILDLVNAELSEEDIAKILDVYNNRAQGLVLSEREEYGLKEIVFKIKNVLDNFMVEKGLIEETEIISNNEIDLDKPMLGKQGGYSWWIYFTKYMGVNYSNPFNKTTNDRLGELGMGPDMNIGTCSMIDIIKAIAQATDDYDNRRPL